MPTEKPSDKSTTLEHFKKGENWQLLIVAALLGTGGSSGVNALFKDDNAFTREQATSLETRLNAAAAALDRRIDVLEANSITNGERTSARDLLLLRISQLERAVMNLEDDVKELQ